MLDQKREKGVGKKLDKKGNKRSATAVSSVGNTSLPDPFYLNNVLIISDIIQIFLFVRCFITDN